ncbi:MAG: hypothetical protein WCF92_00645 [bacterium]
MTTIDLEKISLKLSSIQCEDNLENKIIASIRSRQKRNAEIKFGIFGLSFLTGLVSSFYILERIFINFQSSVFYEYLSLLISDTKFAITNWKPTILLLLESAPILDLFITVSIFGILLYLLSKTTEGASSFLRPRLIYK